MPKYENIFICAVDLPTEKISAVTERVKSIITKNEGEVLTVNEWGKRKLAYPISGHSEGVYTYLEFNSKEQAVRQVEDMFRNIEGVLRFLTVKKKKERKKETTKKKTEIK